MKSRALYIIIALVLIIISVAYFFAQKNSNQKQKDSIVISAYYQGKAFLPFVDGFKEELDKLVMPAENIRVTYKITDVIGDKEILERVKNLIATEKPDLIVPVGPQMLTAVKTATAESNIPVLYGFGGNAVDAGFIKSFQSSGNNLTGVSWRAQELAGKRLEILKRIDPKINTVLVYVWSGGISSKLAAKYVEQSAKVADLKITFREVTTTEEFAADLAKFDKKDFDAVSYLNDSFFVKNNALFQKVLAEKKIPAVFHEAAFARSGALASYGSEFKPAGKQLARLAKKVIDGMKPIDIPSEVSEQLLFILNEDTAKKLGLTFSSDIMSLANEIIPVSVSTTTTP